MGRCVGYGWIVSLKIEGKKISGRKEVILLRGINPINWSSGMHECQYRHPANDDRYAKLHLAPVRHFFFRFRAHNALLFSTMLNYPARRAFF